MTERAASSELSKNGLSEDQLMHFSEHGWLLLENVIDEAQRQATIDAIGRTLARLGDWEWPVPHVRGFKEQHRYDPFFFEWFKIPGLLAANRQLIGNKNIRVRYSTVFVTDPHPDREAERDSLSDPDAWAWHRDFHPQWMIHRHLTDTRLIHSTAVVTATYYTPISPESGSTAFLDGSHRYDGGYETARVQHPVVQPTADAGCMVLFTEAMWHAAAPVVADGQRIATFTWMAAPWFGGDDDTIPYGIERFADEELRSLFMPSVFGD